jgi:allantoin racemase
VKLLLVNGNRTPAVTATALAEARQASSAETEVEGVTATFGANIVSTVADNTVAAHAVLDVLARHHRGFDAAVLAISLDSGLFAARQLLPIPVVGITEAAVLTACMLGERFGMVTFGLQTRSLYLELVERYGAARRLAECRTIETATLTDYLNPDQLAARIAEEATVIASDPDVGAVIICGAALAGVARRIQPSVPVALIDGVACAVRQAESLVRGAYRWRPAALAMAAPVMKGIAPELAELFQPG